MLILLKTKNRIKIILKKLLEICSLKKESLKFPFKNVNTVFLPEFQR